jgi:hypothetical protein
MAHDSIVANLFGLDPALLGQQQMTQDNLFGMKMAQLAPEQAAAAPVYSMTQNLGRQVGNLLGIEDPVVAKNAKVLAAKKKAREMGLDKNSAEGMLGYAKLLEEEGLDDYAYVAKQEADKMRKTQAELAWKDAQRQEELSKIPLNQARAVAAGQEKKTEVQRLMERLQDPTTPEEEKQYIKSILAQKGQSADGAAEQEIFNSFLAKFGGDRQKAALAYYEYMQEKKKETARAGASNVSLNAGNVKNFDKLAGVRDKFFSENKPYLEMRTMTNKLETALDQISSLGDNVTPKGLAKIFSDSSIGQKEADAFRNFGGVGERIAGSINRFLAGEYTPAQREEAKKLVKALRESANKSYSKALKETREMGKVEGLSDEQLRYIAPDFEDDTPVAPAAPKQGVTASGNKYTITKG